ETLESYAAARKAGTITFVGYNYRWAPLVQYARNLVSEGKLGKLTHYHGRFLNGYAGDPLGFLSWRFEQAQGLGTLGDLMSHALHGTKGAVKWNFERMNELQLQFRRDDDLAQEGYTTVLSGPAHPYHRHFNPGPGISLGYDDLKVIEAYEFLSSIASGKQGEPGFREAAAVARVQQAIIRSWASKRWETVDKE